MHSVSPMLVTFTRQTFERRGVHAGFGTGRSVGLS